MDQPTRSLKDIIRQPSAFAPSAMSLRALTLVLSHIATFGATRQPDEGTLAHLWQNLMLGQIPVLAFFAIRWLPRAPKQTLHTLGLQTAAALASIAPVFLLKL